MAHHMLLLLLLLVIRAGGKMRMSRAQPRTDVQRGVLGVRGGDRLCVGRGHVDVGRLVGVLNHVVVEEVYAGDA